MSTMIFTERIGKILLQKLIQLAKQGLHYDQRIDAENQSSVDFHENLGSKRWGLLKNQV
jgi:phosphinothricin acetyltransferase